MHAAIAQQSDKMKLPRSPTLHGLLEQRHVLQLLVGNEQVNSRDVHVHDATRAHVHVPDFAVAHLSFGQSDERPRRMNQSIGKFLDQLVVRRLPGQRNRIPLRFRAVSPSIQHGQDNWFWLLGHRSSFMNLNWLSRRTVQAAHYLEANSFSAPSSRSTSSAVL